MAQPPKQPSDRAVLLRAVPALRVLPEDQLSALAERVAEITVAPGTTLIDEGNAATDAFVIVDGWAAVAVRDEPVAALGPGQFVGEVALIDHGPRTATVVAKTPMRLLVVGPAVFADIAADAAATRVIATGLAERLRHADAALGARPPAPEQ